LTYLKVEGQEEYAFGQLVKKYQEKVYWHARRMVIDHDDANDLTQEIFIKVWKNIKNFRSDSGLYTWIFRITVNETINYLKKKKRRFLLPLSNIQNQMERKIDNQVNGDEIHRKLHKAILKLPVKQKQVFNLRYFEEMSYKEMSNILNTSEGALKASYHHAVKKIEKEIKSSD